MSTYTEIRDLRYQMAEDELRKRLADREDQRQASRMLTDDAKYSWQILNEGWVDAQGVKHKALNSYTGDEMMDGKFSPSQTYSDLMTKWRTEQAKRRGLSVTAQEEYATKVQGSFLKTCGDLMTMEVSRQAAAGMAEVVGDATAQWNLKRGEWAQSLKAGREAVAEGAAVVGAPLASADAGAGNAQAMEGAAYAGLVDAVRDQFAKGVVDLGVNLHRASAGLKGFDKTRAEGILFAKGQLDATVKEFADAGEFGAAKALCEIYNDIDIRDRVGTEEAREKLKWVEGEEAKWMKQRALDAKAKAKAEQAQRSYEYITENHDWATACRKLQFWANSEDVDPAEREVYQKQANLLMSGFPKGVWKPEDVADLLDQKAMNLNWMRARHAGAEDVQKAQMDLCVSIEAAMYHGALEPKRYERLMKTVREELSSEKADALKALARAFGVPLGGDKISNNIVADTYGAYQPYETYRFKGAGELSGREFSIFYTEVCDALDAMDEKIDRKAATTELIADIKRRYAEKKWDRLASVSATEFFKDYERDRLAGMDYGGYKWDDQTDADDDWPRGGVETREGWTREEKYAEDHPLGAKSLAPIFGGWGDEAEWGMAD